MSRGPVPISRAVLKEHCARLGCIVPEATLSPLATFLELLTQWNRVMNLVGTRHWQDTLNLLLVDSFHLADFLRSLPLPAPLHTWDLGAGAGLPGIPLRMVWPEGRYFLVEAREKRALFLSTVLARLTLPETEVFRGRAEDFFIRAPKPAQLVVSRAFMPWRQVLELVRPHIQQPSGDAGAAGDIGSADPADTAAGTQGGRVIFLTLEKAPATPPQGWVVEASQRYIVDKDARYFWCLRAIGSMEATPPPAGQVC